MYSSMWINSAQPDAADIFSRNLRYLLNRVNPRGKPLAFACIGSANVPGDSLGPLMGHHPHQTRASKCLWDNGMAAECPDIAP